MTLSEAARPPWDDSSPRPPTAPLRVGVVTTSYPREPGDPAGTFVAGFTRWLVGAGAEVEVIAAGEGASTVEEVDGVPVRRVPGRGLFYRGGAPDALAGGGSGAWLAGAAFQADLTRAVTGRIRGWQGVVSHWAAPSALAVEAAGLLRRHAPPHLAIVHSSDAWLLRRSAPGRAVIRALARRTDLVYAAPHLVLPGAPGRVVPMGVDASALQGDRERGRIRFGLAAAAREGHLTALFLGRLVPVKGLDLVLDALPPEVDLLVAGEGPQRDAWQRRGPARVRFLGEVRGAARADLLAAADVLVFSSRTLPDGRHEGTPTVLLEALAAGLPVLAVRGPGVEDVLHPGEDALLVPPTVTGLREALRRLAHQPALLVRLRAGAARAGAAHDWKVVGPRLGGTWWERVCAAAMRTPIRTAPRRTRFLV